MVAGGLLWVDQSDSGAVVRIDPRTGRVRGDPIATGGALLTLAADRGKVWVVNAYSHRLVTIDAKTAQVIGDRPLPGVSGIATSSGTVWTTFFTKGEVRGFDAGPGTSTGTPLRVRGGVDGIGARGDAVWVLGSTGVTHITP